MTSWLFSLSGSEYRDRRLCRGKSISADTGVYPSLLGGAYIVACICHINSVKVNTIIGEIISVFLKTAQLIDSSTVYYPLWHHPRHRYLWQGWCDNSNTRNCGFVEVWSMLPHAFSHQWTRIGEGYNLYPTRNLVPDHVVKHLVLFRKSSS